MSIASEITRLQGAKADLKTAIEAKGVTVGDITIDGYAAKVAEIPTGGVTPPETPTDALLFYATDEFTIYDNLGSKTWDGTIYYSTDHENWAVWDGVARLTSVKTNNWHKVYLRGSGNRYTVNSDYSKGTLGFIGHGINCVGNCNNLLDYTTTPTLSQYAFMNLFRGVGNVYFDVTLPATTLSNYCYSNMFQGCASLTTAPALPATTLTSSCYSNMFNGCASLTTPPALPATTLATYCYTNMFNGCASLTTAPALPATTLTSNCYKSMFSSCSGIRLSTTQTGEYQTEYRIPTSGEGTDATGALNSMFSATGGTFKGTPVINTTYYTSNTVIPAT